MLHIIGTSILEVCERPECVSSRCCVSRRVPGGQDVLVCLYGITPVYLRESSMYEPQNEISNNVVYATSKGSDQPAHARSLIRAFASRLDIL